MGPAAATEGESAPGSPFMQIFTKLLRENYMLKDLGSIFHDVKRQMHKLMDKEVRDLQSVTIYW